MKIEVFVKGLVITAFVFLSVSFTAIYAQDSLDVKNELFTEEFKRHTIFLEVIGSIASAYSINYDYLVAPSFSVRAGTGIFTIRSENWNYDSTYFCINQANIYSFCINTSYLINFPNSPSHIEVGLGGTVHLTYDQILVEKATTLPANKISIRTYAPPSLVGIIGYRLQPVSGGFNFRIVVNPVLQFWNPNYQLPNDSNFKIWGGISFGYTF